MTSFVAVMALLERMRRSAAGVRPGQIGEPPIKPGPLVKIELFED